jgi:hypothetical protein
MAGATPYRLLFFRASLLERWEEIEAPSALEAVEEAARRPSDDVVELWSSDRRIASFRPLGSNPKR